MIKNDTWLSDSEQVGNCANRDECGDGMKYDHVICLGDRCKDYKEKKS